MEVRRRKIRNILALEPSEALVAVGPGWSGVAGCSVIASWSGRAIACGGESHLDQWEDDGDEGHRDRWEDYE